MLTQSTNDAPGVLSTNGAGKVPTLPDGGWRGLGATFRWIVIAVLTVAVLLPLSFIVVQSFLNAPFFDATGPSASRVTASFLKTLTSGRR